MRTSIDPDTLPFDPQFELERGPAVDASRLTPEALRARFLQSRSWQTEQSSDVGLQDSDRQLRPAAVLIALIARPSGVQVLFTVRSSRLQDHAGQISFPGGRQESGDASAIDAALREAREEIDLDRGLVEVIGTMPSYSTISGFCVVPVVGLIAPAVQLRADPLEVEEFFEVPLAFLMNGANHQRRVVAHHSRRRYVYSMEYYGPRRYLIWGATAAMLRNLYRFLLD
ncbi:MAG TPA: CoA pyrophosphatase [Burkholderiaceae bacterium]|nr:CoA pyrophosphatase [Burkholderiaceae bacterium]